CARTHTRSDAANKSSDFFDFFLPPQLFWLAQKKPLESKQLNRTPTLSGPFFRPSAHLQQRRFKPTRTCSLRELFAKVSSPSGQALEPGKIKPTRGSSQRGRSRRRAFLCWSCD